MAQSSCTKYLRKGININESKGAFVISDKIIINLFKLHTRLILIIGVSLLTGSSYGAELFRKQSGTLVMPDGAVSAGVTIEEVDMTKSFVVFSSTNDADQPNYFQVGGQLLNSTTLQFTRGQNVSNVTISWQVFEFESGVSVQRGVESSVGEGSIAGGGGRQVPINCVDLNKSFAIVSMRAQGSAFGDDDGVVAELTSSTNLDLVINELTATVAVNDIYWQVIEYEAAQVQLVNGVLSDGSQTATSTLASTVDPAKTLVIGSHWVSANVSSDDLPRIELTNGSTLTYTRVGTTSNVNLVNYIIEFTDETVVGRGIASFSSGSTTANVDLTALNITDLSSTGVIAPGNLGRQGNTSFGTTDNMGHAWFAYTLTSTTNLDIQRAVGTGSTANAPWQVVTFENSGLQQNTFYSIQSGDWEDNATWSFTPDGSSGSVPVNVYPRRTNSVVVQSSHTIIIDDVTDNDPCSLSPDDLLRSNIGPFDGSGDQMFYHTGDILISAGGTISSNEELMLEGYTAIENGGTLNVNEDIVNLGYLEVATSATFNNSDDLILSGNSTTIINNTSTGNDDIYIDHTDATLCGEGIMNLGNGGSPDPNVQFFNSGTLSQICSTFRITCSNNCSAFPINPSGSFITGNEGLGGVGNSTNILLWVKADALDLNDNDPVTVWTDFSGNSFNATQSTTSNQPAFTSNAINTLPSISFDGGDFLTLGAPNDLNLIPGADNWSFFSAFNVDTDNIGTLFSKSTTTNRQYQYHIQNNFFNVNLGGNESAGSTTAVDNWVLGTGTNSSAFKNTWLNSGIDISGDGVSTSTSTADVLIGAHFMDDLSTPTSQFTGQIAEIAVYNVEVSDIQRVIIDNYLAAKYDITLVSLDVYTMDDAVNGNYDFEVAGIGQANDGSNHKDARGAGLVRIWNPNDLDNDEFLMWGHDNTNINTTTSNTPVDVDGTVIEERLARIWRVGESGGDVGTVSVSFDFSGIGSPLGSNLRLLIDRDGDGFGDNDVTPIAGAVSNGVVVFSRVNFQNGDRFTLGNTDIVPAPLPITLSSFSAKVAEYAVVVNWTTSSEINNDFFTIQKSLDAKQWQDVKIVDGAGNSNQLLHYSQIDHKPYVGNSYYRLKQTDFDGQFELHPSVLVSVKNDIKFQFKIRPNPSHDFFTLESNVDLESTKVSIMNSSGSFMENSVNNDETNVIIDARGYPPGLYIVRINHGGQTRTIRIVKE